MSLSLTSSSVITQHYDLVVTSLATASILMQLEFIVISETWLSNTLGVIAAHSEVFLKRVFDRLIGYSFNGLWKDCRESQNDIL